jgi:hypothetical protein
MGAVTKGQAGSLWSWIQSHISYTVSVVFHSRVPDTRNPGCALGPSGICAGADDSGDPEALAGVAVRPLRVLAFALLLSPS